MYAEDLAPQDAVNWIGVWHDEVVEEFMHCKDNLPSWGGDIGRQVEQYVEGLAGWVRGSEEWSFDSQRYFGTQGLEIKRSREVYMLPRVEVLEARSNTHRDEVEAEEHAVAAMQIRMDQIVSVD